jgi:hypothetical protein
MKSGQKQIAHIPEIFRMVAPLNLGCICQLTFLGSNGQHLSSTSLDLSLKQKKLEGLSIPHMHGTEGHLQISGVERDIDTG